MHWHWLLRELTPNVVWRHSWYMVFESQILALFLLKDHPEAINIPLIQLPVWMRIKMNLMEVNFCSTLKFEAFLCCQLSLSWGELGNLHHDRMYICGQKVREMITRAGWTGALYLGVVTFLDTILLRCHQAPIWASAYHFLYLNACYIRLVPLS